ncbi:MAG: cation diffusion facilitator family transporter [Pseudomonadales bacterium]|jgi:cation diffusion facilitator family transporter|nr:cation diffusion facilitator family transporter [Pseudomonadales bacterium]MDP4639393.1 cation diffusion facilitator family transporter [Pseudomonadales bacterium]MDP4766245.1 cation diffusion facilitator family transporter [Pseudomonadales bacterium]MDP4876127.1 cation diffusion facilitator family transporter [Pseudomonadales bacterium]MDP4911970.1 cation diffusion facilitator family transporter [Pseudomonadales bacterium]
MPPAKHSAPAAAANTANQQAVNHQAATQRLLLVSGVVDFGLGALKVLVGIVANSHALIADGIHSFSDLATDIMVWFFNRIGAMEPDADHPYGHARFETFGTLILGTLLIVVAGVLIYDSVDRLMNINVQQLPAWPALAAALGSILIKEWLYRITVQLGTASRSKLLLANAWHHRSDALSSVIVLVGVGGAMLGFSWLEMLAAIGVAFMIAQIGWKLARQSVEELVDTAMAEPYVQEIQKSIEDVEGVRGVHSLRTRRMGPDVLADIHLQVNPAISVSEGHHIGEWVTRALLEEYTDLTDVIVHIDAEDDELLEPRDKFSIAPLRREIRTVLTAVWDEALSAEDIHKMTLHYLNNRVDVELHLDQQRYTDRVTATNLQTQLTKLTTHLPWVNRITVWYG